MKSLNALAALINRELGSTNLFLSKIDVPISQQDEWVWFFCFFSGEISAEEVEQINLLLLELMSPLHAGEVIGHSSSTTILVAENDCLPVELLRNQLLLPSSNISVPSYVANLLNSMSNSTLSFFFRLQKQEILDADSISRNLSEKTWFRSQAIPFKLRGRSVDISFGASRTKLRIQPPQNIISQFEASKGFYAVFRSDYSSDKIKCNVYQPSSPIQPLTIGREEFLAAINFSSEGAYGFNPCVPLQIDLSVAEYEGLAANSILEDIRSSTITCQKCREVVAEQLEIERQETLKRLENRRGLLVARRTIFALSQGREVPLGYEPSNETELIILATKLEPYLNECLGEFQILEHTSQMGIDSLIRIRRTSSSILESPANAEFEYELSNFFKHEHPIEQTNYILCWTMGGISDGTYKFGKKGIRSDGEIAMSVSSAGWTKVLTFNTHMIYVLPLEDFPNLRIKN